MHSFQLLTLKIFVFSICSYQPTHTHSHDPVHQPDQADDQQKDRDQSHHDDVQWVEFFDILLVFAALAQADQRPGHGAHGAQQRAFARMRLHHGRLQWGIHDPAPSNEEMAGRDTSTAAVDCGAAGVLARTSKKAEDNVMGVTSFEIRGSITNAAGYSFFSPGSSVYWLKQKHSSLLKCAAAWRGAELGMACAAPRRVRVVCNRY